MYIPAGGSTNYAIALRSSGTSGLDFYPPLPANNGVNYGLLSLLRVYWGTNVATFPTQLWDSVTNAGAAIGTAVYVQGVLIPSPTASSSSTATGSSTGVAPGSPTATATATGSRSGAATFTAAASATGTTSNSKTSLGSITSSGTATGTGSLSGSGALRLRRAEPAREPRQTTGGGGGDFRRMFARTLIRTLIN
jgi:hypothetical protein